MKKALLPAVLLLPSFVHAQNGIPAAERKGFDRITQSDLRKDLAYIASDALRGRLSLQPGDDQAAEWVAKQFAAAGLKPITGEAGTHGYFQPFQLVEYAPDRAASSVTLKRAGKAAQGATLYVTLEPCDMCIGAMFHARIARVVYGATDPKKQVLKNQVKVEGGVLARECGEILTAFFAAKR